MTTHTLDDGLTSTASGGVCIPEFDFSPLVQFNCSELKQFPRFVLISEIAAAWFDTPDCKTATVTLKSGVQFTVDAASLVRAYPPTLGSNKP